MFKKGILIFFSLIIYGAIPVIAQIAPTESSPNSQEAIRILNESRKAVYGDSQSQKIKNLHIVTSGESYTQQTTTEESGKPPTFERREDISNEYSIQLPDFLRRIIITKSKKNTFDTKVQITATANKEEIDLKGEMFVNGQRIKLQDDIGKYISSGYAKLKDVSPLFSEKEAPKFSRDSLDKQVSDFTFPLILTSIYEQNPQFTYIGKAFADGKSALVLEIASNDTGDVNQKLKKVEKTRYYFDSASYFLIMITSDFQADDITTTSSIYFSEHKSFKGINIPTRIKQESKINLKFNQNISKFKTKPSETIRITDIVVQEFELDKEFPKSTFEIKR